MWKRLLARNCLHFRFIYYLDENNSCMLQKENVFNEFCTCTFSLFGKPKDQLSFLKLPANLELMQRFLIYFKRDKLSKKNSLPGHVTKLFSRGLKVAGSSTAGYVCYMCLNTIKAKITNLEKKSCDTNLVKGGLMNKPMYLYLRNIRQNCLLCLT